jgi:hypothetical protein
MASNSSSEYKVVADKIVSPDEDIIVKIAGAMYKGSIEEPNRYITASDLEGITGGSALNYVQVVSEQVTITTSPQDLISLTITTTGAPVQINLTGEGSNAAAGSWVKVALHRDGTLIGQTIQIESSEVSENVPYALNFIDDVAAGEYVYSAKIVGKSSGNWQFGEVSGPIMNAVELTGFKGDDGASGDTADFVFNYDDGDEESTMTVANHDMIIRTTRTGDQDADISLNSADDIWLNAGDEVEIDANSTILLRATDGIFLESTDEPNNRIATIGDVANGVGLVVPVNIKDTNDENFITFSRTDTGTARIATPQDDLSLRSARDITLFAGSDGPGAVYIGWGDAEGTPDATNRVATIADIQAADTADFVFDTVEAPDYESTMTVTNNDMVIKTVVDTEASGNIKVESAQKIILDAVSGAYLEDDSTESNRIATLGDVSSAGTGDITFVDSTISNDTGDDIVIQNKNESGVVKARISLDQSNEQVLIEAIRENDDWFNDTQWDTAVWSGSTVSITNTPDVIAFFDTVPGNVTRVSVNDGTPMAYEGASYGDGAISINVDGSPFPEQDPLTVTEIRFYYSQASVINIDHDNSEFEIISRGMSMTIDSSGDLELNARDEDIDLRANDDIRFTANWNAGGTEPQWRMSNTGRFELPGAGYIENIINGASDGSNSDTIKIVPDADLLDENNETDAQYIVIDPTYNNHIHIRAGGNIDESTANLILGGERNKVSISDGDREVVVTSRPPLVVNTYLNTNEESSTSFVTGSTADIQINYTVNVGGTDYVVDSITSIDEGVVAVTATGAVFTAGQNYTFRFEPPFDNEWRFDSDGTFYGPAMGGVRVNGLLNSVGEDLYVTSTDANINMSATDNVTLTSTDSDVVISASGGEYLTSATDPNNQIATIGDIQNTVSNGMVRYSPTFAATGLAFTGSGATYPTYNSYYVKSGSMVSFVIEVDLSTVTNFGTGQYKLQLPFTPAVGFNHFSGWAWADPNVDPDTGTGHTIINADTAGVTDVLDLHYLKSAGGANSPIREGLFLQGTPVTLTTISKIYVNGTYIAVTEAP